MTEDHTEYLINGVPVVAGERNYTPVPYILPNEFQYIIRQALSSFEGITHFEWNSEKFAYDIEYASRPIEITAPLDCLDYIENKKIAARVAAGIAYGKILDNIQLDWDDFDDFPSMPYIPRLWCMCELSIRWDSSINSLVYVFSLIRGDRVSYMDMRKAVERSLLQIEKTQVDLKEALIAAGVDIQTINLREYLLCDSL